MILEVVAAVILLFKNQDFSDKKAIPDIIYQQCSIKQTNSVDQDCYKFIDLINKGVRLDSILPKKDKEIDDLKSRVEALSSDTLKDFYYYIQQIEKLRLSSQGLINLKSNNSKTDKAVKIVEQILFLNGRLTKDSNSKEEVIAAFENFKKDNQRGNKAYVIYLQDVPLFIKEYLEENYELKFYISNPDIPSSLITGSNNTIDNLN